MLSILHINRSYDDDSGRRLGESGPCSFSNCNRKRRHIDKGSIKGYSKWCARRKRLSAGFQWKLTEPDTCPYINSSFAIKCRGHIRADQRFCTKRELSDQTPGVLGP